MTAASAPSGPELGVAFKHVLASSPLWQFCASSTQRALRALDTETLQIAFSHIRTINVKIPCAAQDQHLPTQLAAFISRTTNLSGIGFTGNHTLANFGVKHLTCAADYISDLLSLLGEAQALCKVRSCTMHLRLPTSYSLPMSCIEQLLLSLPGLMSFNCLGAHGHLQRQLLMPPRCAHSLKQLRLDYAMDTDMAELLIQQLEHLPKLTELYVRGLCCSLSMLRMLASRALQLQTLYMKSFSAGTETQDDILLAAEVEGLCLCHLRVLTADFDPVLQGISMHALNSLLAVVPSLRQLEPLGTLNVICRELEHTELAAAATAAAAAGRSLGSHDSAHMTLASVAREVLPRMCSFVDLHNNASFAIRFNDHLVHLLQLPMATGAPLCLPPFASCDCTIDITDWSQTDDVPSPPQPEQAGHVHSIHPSIPPLVDLAWDGLATIAEGFPVLENVLVEVKRRPLHDQEVEDEEADEDAYLHGPEIRSLQYWEILRLSRMLVTLCRALPSVSCLQLKFDSEYLFFNGATSTATAAATQMVLDLALCTSLSSFDMSGLSDMKELMEAWQYMLGTRGLVMGIGNYPQD